MHLFSPFPTFDMLHVVFVHNSQWTYIKLFRCLDSNSVRKMQLHRQTNYHLPNKHSAVSYVNNSFVFFFIFLASPYFAEKSQSSRKKWAIIPYLKKKNEFNKTKEKTVGAVLHTHVRLVRFFLRFLVSSLGWIRNIKSFCFTYLFWAKGGNQNKTANY